MYIIHTNLNVLLEGVRVTQMVLCLHRQLIELAGEAQKAIGGLLQHVPCARHFLFNCVPHIQADQIVNIHAAAPFQAKRLGQKFKFTVLIANQGYIEGPAAEVVDQQSLAVLHVPLRAVAHRRRGGLVHQLQVKQTGGISRGAELFPALFPIRGRVGQIGFFDGLAGQFFGAGLHVAE